MHEFLRAIGFSNIKNRTQLEKIIGIVMAQPTEKKMIKIDEKTTLTEISKDFSKQMGVTIVGEYDEKGFFHLDHYFPYFKSSQETTITEIVVNKRMDTDSYTAMCDDFRVGVSLIFYLQNGADFVEIVENGENSEAFSKRLPITLAGLSIEGNILLGNAVDAVQMKKRYAEDKQRKKLIIEAKNGNQEAIDNLTIDDLDMYAMISRRAKNEDIYTIVENTFIPYGSESDNYSIIGTIIECELLRNSFSGEEVYAMWVTCNDMSYQICINKNDLLGEPAPGRRFKGNIWLQGSIDFKNIYDEYEY